VRDLLTDLPRTASFSPEVESARWLTDESCVQGARRTTPVIGQTFPLARAADAHAAIEGPRHHRQDAAVHQNGQRVRR
jgi:hypothetical protein